MPLSSSPCGDIVDKLGASCLWRNRARRALPWSGDGLGDGRFRLEEPRGRGAAHTARGLSMPRTACPMRLRMLFKSENAAIDGRFRAPSEAIIPLSNGTDATRAVANADTSAATSAAMGDAASVVIGAITAASVGRGDAVRADVVVEEGA
jgi:hypothetical protein